MNSRPTVTGTIGLVRVKDHSYVDRLTFGLDDARIASGLRAVGFASSLYAGRPNGRIQDLTRQLLRMRTDAVLFWVHPEGAGAARQLTLGMKSLRTAVRIFWWGSDLKSLTEARTSGAEVLAAQLPEEVLPRLVESGLLAP